MQNKNFSVTLLLLLLSSWMYGQGTWTQKANYGGNGKQEATGFSIGNFGYLGLGYEGLGYATDFEKYDPATDTWTPIANFPGGARWGNVEFSVGNFGYVSTGFRSSPNTFYSDLWQYNPVSNVWTAMAPFPGGGRWHGVGFSIGNKGYVGIGYNGLTATYFSDLWEYDPSLNNWTAKANFPGTLNFATTFTIGNKAYIVGGEIPPSFSTHDLFEFDPIANSWAQKTPYPGVPCDRMIAFTIGNYGYVGTGQAAANGSLSTDFYRYDPTTDIWTPVTFFAGTARWLAVGFSINNKGYLATGNTGCPSPGCDQFDLWEFDPAGVGINEVNTTAPVSIAPNPFQTQTIINTETDMVNATLTLTNYLGQTIKQLHNLSGKSIVLQRDNIPCGMYFMHLKQGNTEIASGKLVITD